MIAIGVTPLIFTAALGVIGLAMKPFEKSAGRAPEKRDNLKAYRKCQPREI